MVQMDFVQAACDESLPRRGSPGRDTASALLELLERKGLPARIVPFARASDLQTEFAGRHGRGEFDEEFYQECLTELTFTAPEGFPARSIIVAAVPRPETAAVFHVGGAERKLTIPPTYTAYRAITQRWLSWLSAILESAGYRAAATDLPLKLLATRSGLASYGRNNITYVQGLGSYFELVSAYTDVPCADYDWTEARMLDRCLRCRACVNRCPTRAIPLDRFLLGTHRCLVFHNEKPGEIPFPDWIDSSAHRTLIGCMECQWVCPENRNVKGWTGETEQFSEEETAMLLSGADQADLPEPTVAKLERLDALRFLDRLPRNLGAALR